MPLESAKPSEWRVLCGLRAPTSREAWQAVDRKSGTANLLAPLYREQLASKEQNKITKLML